MLLRWPSLVLGAATFAAAHTVEVVLWTSWFSPQWSPFFLNSGRAVAFTVVCVVIAGVIAALWAKDRREVLIHAANVTAGAAAAMIVTLFWTGPGTLFPIAIVFGIAILAAGTYLGALALFPFKSASRAGDSR
jgi:hypothetical protein